MARQRLADFLAWAGWSQSEFARRAGVHQTTVNKILGGERAPGLGVVHAIERCTAAARDDGQVWADGPIRTEEWVGAEATEGNDTATRAA